MTREDEPGLGLELPVKQAPAQDLTAKRRGAALQANLLSPRGSAYLSIYKNRDGKGRTMTHLRLFRTTGGEHMLYDMTTARPTHVRVVQKPLSRSQRRKDALFRWLREGRSGCRWLARPGRAAIHR